jgi:hypothetical protein
MALHQEVMQANERFINDINKHVTLKEFKRDENKGSTMDEAMFLENEVVEDSDVEMLLDELEAPPKQSHHQLYAAGMNEFLQLGLGTCNETQDLTPLNHPKIVVKDIQTGVTHQLILTEDGVVLRCGISADVSTI